MLSSPPSVYWSGTMTWGAFFQGERVAEHPGAATGADLANLPWRGLVVGVPLPISKKFPENAEGEGKGEGRGGGPAFCD